MSNITLRRYSSHEAFPRYNSYDIFERRISRGELAQTEAHTVYRQKIRLYKGLFAILFITTFITIFELVFYILVIYPSIRVGILSFVNYDASQVVREFLRIARRREDYLIYQNQIKSYVAVSILIISLVCALTAVYVKIHSLDNQDHHYTHSLKKLSFADVTFYSIVTIVILILFQVIFYNFGIRYEYISPEEMLYKIVEGV